MTPPCSRWSALDQERSTPNASVMPGTEDDEAPRGPPPANPQRGRLQRSGRMLPLVRPGTIAPPVKPGEDVPDDYDEVSIEPSIPESDDEPDEEDETHPGQKRP